MDDGVATAAVATKDAIKLTHAKNYGICVRLLRVSETSSVLFANAKKNKWKVPRSSQERPPWLLQEREQETSAHNLPA